SLISPEEERWRRPILVGPAIRRLGSGEGTGPVDAPDGEERRRGDTPDGPEDGEDAEQGQGGAKDEKAADFSLELAIEPVRIEPEARRHGVVLGREAGREADVASKRCLVVAGQGEYQELDARERSVERGPDSHGCRDAGFHVVAIDVQRGA